MNLADPISTHESQGQQGNDEMSQEADSGSVLVQLPGQNFFQGVLGGG